MAIIKCPECSKEISDKAVNCPNCGAAVNTENSISAAVNKSGNEKVQGKLFPLSVGVAGVVLAIVVGVSVRIIDGKTLSTGETKLSSLRSELSSVSSELTSAKSQLASINSQIESQSKKIKPLEDVYDVSLAAGTYTVGTDLAPGIYHFTYNLKDPDDDWGDYIYVIFADSEGKDETLGGTKFDYRTQADTDGEQVSIKLDAGSKITVTSEYGLWNPGEQTAANTEK